MKASSEQFCQFWNNPGLYAKYHVLKVGDSSKKR